MKNDDLEEGYSLNDFGLTFNEKSNKNMDLRKPKHDYSDESYSKDSAESNDTSISSADYSYTPQFQGFSDEILAPLQEPSEIKNSIDSSVSISEKDLILQPQGKQSEVSALFIAYMILFVMLLIFMPQIYLANNIYTSSKNINFLKSQKEALRDENSDLQKKLESVKFNFLTLEIEEIE